MGIENSAILFQGAPMVISFAENKLFKLTAYAPFTNVSLKKTANFASKLTVFMVDDNGFEPLTLRTSSGCSSQLS